MRSSFTPESTPAPAPRSKPKGIIVAVDGYSSCGKSTLAKGLAKSLHYAYLDSGAMYRAVTLFFLDHEIDYHDPAAVDDALLRIELHFERVEGQNHTFLNGADVERRIREMRVSEHVSPVSTISAVRRAMVRQQQSMGRRRGIVADGRDIGTVVFPDAELKIFLTADIDVRTSRRHLELAARGIDADWNEIKNNLRERDHIDSTRADSPLRQADDAIVIDNTLLSEEEQLEKALQLARERIEAATRTWNTDS
jgi:cytidylate kinase